MEKEASDPGGLSRHARLPLSIEAVYLAAPALVLMVAALLNAIKPYDYFWALAQGRAIAQSGANPSQNLFLYTLPADAPYFNQPWLAQLILYGLASSLGHAANVVLLAVALAVAMLAILDTGLRLGISARSLAVAALVASPFLAMGAGVRTQLFAFPCFGLAAWTLFAPGWNRRRLLLAMLVTAAHANLHGSFVLLPVLAGVAMLGKPGLPTRTRAMAVLAVTVAACVHPAGPRVFAYALSQPMAMGVTGRSSVEEWRALPPGTPLGAGFIAGLLVLAVVALRARDRLRLDVALAFAGLAVAALATARLVPFAALLAPLVVPPAKSAPVAPPPTRRQGVVHLALLSLLALLVVASLPGAPLARMLANGRSPSQPSFATDVPVGLVQKVAALRPGRVFHTQAVGGLLEWTLCATRPEPVAFVDQRFELIPASVWREYTEVCAAAAGFDRILRRYGIAAVLAEPSEAGPLLESLAHDPGWHLAGREGSFRLYLRQ